MSGVAIVDYGINNVRSVKNAVEYCGFDPVVTHDADAIADASHVILPGVGAFGDAMSNIRARGIDEMLERHVREKGKPFLAVCLGMQLLANNSEEHADLGIAHRGLGWFDADVLRLMPNDPTLKIPHMGWNMVAKERNHPILANIRENNLAFYFVHSFGMRCRDANDVVGYAQYGQPVTAIIARDNIAATQFHPEKSQDTGIELMSNFLRWNP
ncbi:imidazole glycerol phosphate synthase subunit HisH [Bradyrhizobium sp. NC92]|uniref:imidazole glycerol phosphate synthase subunit HisH n=1 Tax=Bradyrhizobium sp. (strain NC92) TaxID=55395 RepID=UPI0021AA606D|nr:imidazole glycerol phosphate synthase subunit HisH [Bradyrhizobium sp. NC92]UWU66956.1 imidazole glycerol phosphate synthase subunit HisH [Bradyrhizobium sp. NC92]